ncbi:hypothetical protein ABZT43_03965 [Streptomyces sp. NPDC005349]|uniref:hypothetical protein n=1 Tax=Streptomyces sp. NPDC005349 TaxID=3157037 RepID=UPI0033BADFD2
MSEYPEIAARFARDTAGHKLTVLHDDGLYRHLRLEAQDGSGYRFDLHTSPNRLMFHGEVGTYIFSVWPTADLFRVFSESSVGDQPNFGYWMEKLAAWNEPAIQFSCDLFNKKVAGELAKAEGFFPGVTAAWESFASAEYNTEYEQVAWEALAAFEYLPEGQWGDAWRFRYTSEWKLDDYDWRYLWACHAALYGIAKYDAAKAVAA